MPCLHCSGQGILLIDAPAAPSFKLTTYVHQCAGGVGVIAVVITVVAVGGLVIVADATSAHSAIFVLMVTLTGFGWAPFVGNSLERYIPHSLWDRMSMSHETSRRWGVSQFNSFLSRIGWNKLIFAMREDSATGERDRWDPRHMRSAAAGHGWGFLLHAATAIWAGASRGWVALIVLLLAGVVLHFYPVLLQIRVLTRLRER
nr:hypothetical protein [Corynebacterium sp. CCUG 69979]